MEPSDEKVVSATIAWLERFVIGLNLCPFARAIHVKNQIRYVVSHARKSSALLEDLRQELILMSASSTAASIQVGMSIDEFSKSHGLTTGVRNLSQLILNKVKYCAELGLSSLIEN